MIFTKQERNIILFVVFALLFGLFWLLIRKFIFQQSPQRSVLQKTEEALKKEDIKNMTVNVDEDSGQIEIEKVNINEATAEDIASIPYLGLFKAQAIVAWREEHGKFENQDELIQVKGIGKALLNKISNYIEI